MKPQSVTLRPFTREEYHVFYQDYVADPIMDPNVYHYSREYVDRCYDYNLSRQSWYPIFGIFTEDGECVGTLSLKRIDPQEKRCEIGIMLRDDTCKNRGYGTQALRQAIQIARDVYHVEHIYADTMGSNTRMQHIFDKLGFRFIGRTHDVYNMGNRWEDKLDYVLE